MTEAKEPTLAHIGEEAWDLVPVGRYVAYGYKHRRHISYVLAWLKKKFDVGGTEILVTGRANTGKTVLMDHLLGDAHKPDWTMPDFSRKAELHIVSGRTKSLLMRVAPGQNSRERSLTRGTAFSSRSLAGVIHVVDWGYNKPRDAVAQQTLRAHLSQSNGKAGIPELREYNLRKELSDFGDLTERIVESTHINQRPRWLMLVVTKADLFADRLVEAQAYYSGEGSSDFSTIMRQFRERIGKEMMPIICLPAAPHPEDFLWNGESVQSRSLIEAERKRLLSSMMSRMREVIDG